MFVLKWVAIAIPNATLYFESKHALIYEKDNYVNFSFADNRLTIVILINLHLQLHYNMLGRYIQKLYEIVAMGENLG